MTGRRTHQRLDSHTGVTRAEFLQLSETLGIYEAGMSYEDLLRMLWEQLAAAEIPTPRVYGTMGLDAQLFKRWSKTTTLNAVITVPYFRWNAVIKKTQAHSFDLDAFISNTKFGIGLLDALINTVPVGTFTLRAVLRHPDMPGSGTLDSRIVIRILGSMLLDSVIKKNMTGSKTLNAVVRRNQTGSGFLDAVMMYGGGASFFLDSVIKGPRSGSKTLDAVKMRPSTGSFLLDALLQLGVSSTMPLNAVVKSTISGTRTLDAVKKVPNNLGSFTLDSLLQAGFSGFMFFNAVKLKNTASTKTLNAMIGITRTGSYTLNSVMKRNQAFTATFDSVVFATESGTGTLYAVIDAAPPPSSTALLAEMILGENYLGG